MLGLRNRQTNKENEGVGTRTKQVGGLRASQVPLGERTNRLVKRNPSLNVNGVDLEKKGITRASSLRMVKKPDPRPALKSQRSTETTEVLVKGRGVLTRNLSRKSGESLLPGIGEIGNEDIVAELVSDDSGDIKCDAAYSTAMIADIDKDDYDNPQLVAAYVNDIYKYLSFLEVDQGVVENYLAHGEITSKMRAILVDWLAQVHVRFHLLPETLYMTVMLLDRFLSIKRVAKGELQLVGVTCMFIAAKYEEMYAPEINDFVYITDNTYTKRDILMCEMQVLAGLDFKLGRPLAIHFLRRFSKAADVDGETHTMAKYLMEMSLTDYTQCHLPPSLLAASALWLAIRLIDGQSKWCKAVAHYSSYDESSIMSTVHKIALLAHRTHSSKVKQQAIRNKYKTTKYMEMSEHVSLNDTALLESLSQ